MKKHNHHNVQELKENKALHVEMMMILLFLNLLMYEFFFSFVMNVLKQVINSITNEEKRSQIFKIIFDNFFILDRDESIEDSVFEDAMIVAGSAPLEMITKRIDEIGIPTFNKYRINQVKLNLT